MESTTLSKSISSEKVDESVMAPVGRTAWIAGKEVEVDETIDEKKVSDGLLLPV